MKIKNEQFFLTLKKFLQIYLVKNRNCSKNTIKSYTYSLNLFFAYMETEKEIPLYKMNWEYFNYENVSSYIIWLGEKRKCSRQTQIQRLTDIRSFIRYAGILYIATIDIQADIEKNRLRKPARKLIQYHSKEQLSVFLSQPDPRKKARLCDMVFLMLMYDTAARCQEMVDLTPGNLVIDSQSPCVYLTGKGEKSRVVPLMTKTVLYLKHYLDKFYPADPAKRMITCFLPHLAENVTVCSRTMWLHL